MTALAQFEPFAVPLTTEGRLSDPMAFTENLLAGIGERCHEAGASLIGHIKCHARTEAGSFHVSLTSLRSGARCGRLSMTASPVSRVDLDLAVLVYGLEHETLDRVTRTALDALCRRAGVTWAVRHTATGQRHNDHALSTEPAS